MFVVQLKQIYRYCLLYFDPKTGCGGLTRQVAKYHTVIHFLLIFPVGIFPPPPRSGEGERMGKKNKVELLCWDKNIYQGREKEKYNSYD